MRFPRNSLRFIIVILLLSFVQSAEAKVQAFHYGLPPVTDSVAQARSSHFIDSFFNVLPQLASKNIVVGISQPHIYIDKTGDFYLILAMCLLLGLIRFSDRRYFSSLWRAFTNPTLSNRQLKEQLQGASVSNFLMNLFFTISGGAYIYYVAKAFTPQRPEGIPPSLLIVMLIAGMMIIYLAKYAAIRFSGWAFRVEGVTDHYLFNVFLINKIIAISLIPFTILLAFAAPAFTNSIVIVSFILTGLLLINRYTRSWQVFGSFFQYSKFHFFTYLCASELLPLALLMKLLVRGLLHY